MQMMVSIRDNTLLKVENLAEIFLGPVWFVHEGDTLYLLTVQGSDTNWYKNLLVDPTLKISVNGVKTPTRGKPIIYNKRVDDIVRKFKSSTHQISLQESGYTRHTRKHQQTYVLS